VSEVSFSGVVIVAAVAFAVPLLLGFAPGVRLPAVVLEIVAGIIIGPSVLGWVELDEAIEVLSVIGLAFLLFLAGLEIDVERLRGRTLRVAGLGFLLSFGLALVAGYGLQGAGLVDSGLLIAIILAATGLGVVFPILEDAGEISTSFGSLVIAGATIAEFATIILLSLFFAGESSGIGSRVLLLAGFALFTVVLLLALARAERSMRLSAVLLRLQDTSAQIRVRGAFVLLAAFAALAEGLGLEAILGAFIAGAIVTLVDRDEMMTHPEFRVKLQAIGFGVFIPAFFVTTGLRFNLDALFESASTIIQVPIFLVALAVVRGLPALLYRPLLGGRQTAAAGLLQATSLSFIVAATQIGMELGTISEATGAALVAAGLLSVLLFPLGALTLLERREAGDAAAETPSAQLPPVNRLPARAQD